MTSASLPTLRGARRAPLARAAFGDKVVMAATGVLLIAFLIAHVLANLLAYAGPAYINGYGRLLHATGPLLWAARAGLLVAAALHVRAAVRLARLARAARGTPYARERRQAASYATRTIRWGGALLFVFLLVHVPMFTGGALHPSFLAGDDYHNVVRGFRAPWIAALNLVAALAAGLHVVHGVRAASATLGVPPQGSRVVRGTALALGLLIALGFASLPLAVLTGALRE
jgi:succinate dehydrogenase / fumarate reductase cytochrome b subunit